MVLKKKKKWILQISPHFVDSARKLVDEVDAHFLLSAGGGEKRELCKHEEMVQCGQSSNGKS